MHVEMYQFIMFRLFKQIMLWLWEQWILIVIRYEDIESVNKVIVLLSWWPYVSGIWSYLTQSYSCICVSLVSDSCDSRIWDTVWYLTQRLTYLGRCYFPLDFKLYVSSKIQHTSSWPSVKLCLCIWWTCT